LVVIVELYVEYVFHHQQCTIGGKPGLGKASLILFGLILYLISPARNLSPINLFWLITSIGWSNKTLTGVPTANNFWLDLSLKGKSYIGFLGCFCVSLICSLISWIILGKHSTHTLHYLCVDNSSW
jgi:hypothetical protein